MKKLKNIAIFFFFQTKAFAQDNYASDIQEVFANTLVNHEAAYLYEKLDVESFLFIKTKYLSGNLFKGDKCSDLSKEDTLRISASERSTLDSLLGIYGSRKWNPRDLQFYGLKDFKIVDEAIYAKRHKIDFNVYEIMQPIFIRGNTICFSFYMVYCRGHCSIGEIVIHKKMNGKWQRWIRLADFQS